MKLYIVAAWSRAQKFFACWNTGIVGLNPIRSIDVCLRFFCVALWQADHFSKES
jgi:hypothetical protein